MSKYINIKPQFLINDHQFVTAVVLQCPQAPCFVPKAFYQARRQAGDLQHTNKVNIN